MSGEQAVIPSLPMTLPIEAMEAVVGDEFIDRNGHMGAANYYLVFQQGLRHLFRPLGFGDPYRQRGLTIFQREAHISYERELQLGDPISIRSWLVGFDERCLHHYHEMRKGPDGPLVATIEYLSTNVDWETRRSTPFPDDVRKRLERLTDAFSKIDRPGSISRRIALRY